MIDPTSSHARQSAISAAGVPASAVVPAGRRPLTAVFRVLIALAAITGIVIDCAVGDVPRVLSYFTIQSNAVVAVVMLAAAHRAWSARPPLSARLTGAAVLYIAITGLVYHFVLTNDSSGFAMVGDAHAPSEWQTTATQLLHTATPIAVVLDWLLLTTPGRFRPAYAWQWLIYPLLYLPFALIRGALLSPGTEGRYPYPFLDVDIHGYGGVLGNTVIFALAFYVLALVLILLDRIRPHLRGPENRISSPAISPLK
ncbi:Pr6Pr family membrane protein [Streptomyces sp. NPDC050610]|uniref:Pr6Pr family membrane protein n=1 Tax=Streptomyces sp. NPDC050610 TaxID=3157097 RepID=UPI0034327AD1